MDQPFPDRAAAAASFAAHVNPRQGGGVRRPRPRHRDGRSPGLVVRRRLRRAAALAELPLQRRTSSTSGTVIPEVVAAVRAALDHLDVGNHHLISGWRAELARRLAATDGPRCPAWCSASVVASPSTWR